MFIAFIGAAILFDERKKDGEKHLAVWERLKWSDHGKEKKSEWKKGGKFRPNRGGPYVLQMFSSTQLTCRRKPSEKALTHTHTPASLYGRSGLVSIMSTSGELRPHPLLFHMWNLEKDRFAHYFTFQEVIPRKAEFFSSFLVWYQFLEHLIINQHLYETTTSPQHLNKHPSMSHFPFPSFPHSFLFPSLSLPHLQGILWMALFLCSGFVFP